MSIADKIAEELGWEKEVDYPSWGHTEVYLKTISKGYVLAGEKPKDAYWINHNLHQSFLIIYGVVG
jgi:hypothetical protein